MVSNKSEKEIYERSKELLNAPVEESVDYVRDLGEILRYHEWKYYIDNDPIISDYEYDQLFKMLESVEKDHPEWIFPDSPTQRVSSDLTSEFKSVKHLVPMLSLDNSYNETDLRKFDDQVKKLTGKQKEDKIKYTVEAKFDGGSIAVIYEDNIMVRAATRGNGEEGEDITPNARHIPTLPLRADLKSKGISRAELRGEAVIDKTRFAEINKQRGDEGKTLFANPRNTVTGGLRTKDPMETRERGTEVFIFQVAFAEDENGNSVLEKLDGHHNSMETLIELGFNVDSDVRKLCEGIDEVVEHCRYWEDKRDSYPYEIDGMVVKVDDYELQKQCGSTSHHPRWAMAFKFKAKQATTTLERVEFQVGKVGSVTPVAKVTPVALAGVTVSSISLHNEDFITSRDLRIGDKIVIERAGDVIPYVVKSLQDVRSGDEEKIDFPKTCPSCGTELERPEGEAAWRCPNTPDCPAQFLQRMIHHVSKDAMDIDGFGRSYIERFHELGWLDSLADIYRLDYDKIAGLEGFGRKSAENLKKSIEAAKSNPIYRLLNGLSIHHLGKKVSKVLAARVDHVLDLVDWTLEDYTSIDEIGPVLAKNVRDYFNQQKHIDLLKEMESLGVNLSQTEADRPVEVAEDAPLSGKKILFTGSLQSMTRKEAQTLAEENGAQNISAVSSNLDILVVGENAGSKLKKARDIGSVEILTEEEFLERIGS
ncbi:MAG: NAD-dependent DNA ligase LigA [Saprospiraceae bacterium]|nr:NAD-dependent DNA ligase LigA [Saprospiraceae bacterium]